MLTSHRLGAPVVLLIIAAITLSIVDISKASQPGCPYAVGDILLDTLMPSRSEPPETSGSAASAPASAPSDSSTILRPQGTCQWFGTSSRTTRHRDKVADSKRAEAAALAASVDYKAVQADIASLLTDSQPFWPADFGNYGPLFIRMAWHCAGTYRSWDGRGGCEGGRQRFDPERSWLDNTNLDKARSLLRPIKLKYGPGLSWGDLIVLSGTVAIESMGGPSTGFCAGRIDDADGYASEPLGASDVQAAVAPCDVQGNCTGSSPAMGSNVLGLIYVDPHGFMGEPVPERSAPQIRESFGRMGMNDSETVALIGGGHAFGKAHGACPTGAGPDPKSSPADPWPGTCGSGPEKGKGPNTFTNGFELQWTDIPTQWSNQYFTNLVNYEYKLITGPGDEPQWSPTQREDGPKPPLAELGMLTTDVALTQDPAYMELVKLYASDIGKLENDFGAAWYKLVARDMGPATRCINADAPPPQPFQYTLPQAPAALADFTKVAKAVRKALSGVGTPDPSRRRHMTATEASYPDLATNPDKDGDGKPYFGALFVQLAWQCASTFRSTDYQGGCNGARIRLSPQKDWPGNAGMNEVLHVLSNIKSKFDKGDSGVLSWADLIVIAGGIALEDASDADFEFCGGRVDAEEGGPEFLAPLSIPDPVLAINQEMQLLGLTVREEVALQARLRSPVRQLRLGYSGSWNDGHVEELSNRYFQVLLRNRWEASGSAAGMAEYKAEVDGQVLYMLPEDLALLHDATLLDITEEFASDNRAFLLEFIGGWTKLMNADRFDGSRGSVC